jgi:hypothetical protein
MTGCSRGPAALPRAGQRTPLAGASARQVVAPGLLTDLVSALFGSPAASAAVCTAAREVVRAAERLGLERLPDYTDDDLIPAVR